MMWESKQTFCLGAKIQRTVNNILILTMSVVCCWDSSGLFALFIDIYVCSFLVPAVLLQRHYECRTKFFNFKRT